MPALLSPGDVVAGGLRLDCLLATGGMAEVWRAEDQDGRLVALKLPRTDLGDPGMAWLRREHALHAGLSHPHLVRVLGLIDVGSRPGLVLEYCGAGDLVSLLGAPPRQWARPARDIALALRHMHERGVVHRDVKPRNVLFRDSQDAALADLALAASIGSPTRGGGTSAYQAGGRPSETASIAEDVFAFAVLLHELVWGRPPDQAAPSSRHGPLIRPDPRLEPLCRLIAAVLKGGAQPGSLAGFADVLEFIVESCNRDPDGARP